jgi:hypothetical protein
MNTNDVLAANVGELQIIEKGIAINFTVPIAKGGVDAEKRTVRGFATQESVDLHGEEVDFDSVIKAMSFWRGNVREMHQPIAVGKAVDVVVREDVRAVEVESYISKGAESTWQKCLDGTLGYYSIGGLGDRVLGVRSDGTRGPRIIMQKWTELSLVDSGACDGSAVAVVKMTDAGELQSLLPADVAEHGERSDAAHAADAQSVSTRHDNGPNTSTVSKTSTTVEKGFRSQNYDLQTALSIFSLLNSLITDEAYDALYAPEGTPDSGPQVALLRIGAEIMLDFLVTEFGEQFTDDALAKCTDEQRASFKAIVAKAGARHSRKDLAVLQSVHDNTVALGAACGDASMEKTATTTETVTTDAPAATPAAAAAPATPAVEKTTTETPAAAAPATPAAAAAVETTPATPAAAPETSVEKSGVAAAADASTAGIAAIVEAAVTKAVDAALASHKATSDSTIAELRTQIEKLSNEPQTGGPVASANASVIEKMLAAPANVEVEGETAETAVQVIGALEEVAKSISNPIERAAVIEKAIALRQRHRVGAVFVPMPSAR